MTHDKVTVEYLITIFTLGLATALQNKVMDIDTAERFLFTPYTMKLLTKHSVSPELIGLIHSGTELEDTERMFPAKLDEHYLEIIQEALKLLRQAPPLIHESHGRTDWCDKMFE